MGPYPFAFGVASGEPDHESVVLWVGADRAGEVDVEVATDDEFAVVVFAGPVELGEGLTGRIVATGLAPDTAYRYRFWLDNHQSAPARTRTAPAPGESPAAPPRVAHLSCQRYSDGYWTALADVADQAPDVVVHCGDYIYELDQGAVRPLDHGRPQSLDEYRDVWRRYRVEPELQAAHAVAPWFQVWDDHEVENNYQGTDAGVRDEGFAERRAAAYRAWWEFTPTRLDPPGESFPTYRSFDWGDRARFVLLDTRQFRDDQPCGSDLGPRCDASAEVTMLGADQEAWAGPTVRDNPAVWTVVVSSVVVAEWRLLPGNSLWNLDQWDGYPAARDRLFADLLDAPDPVVLSGDVHSSWAQELRTDFDSGSFDPVGVEFVAPGISSTVPDELATAAPFLRLQNNHISYGDADHRGWVLHTVGADEWTAAFRLVEDTTVPDRPVTLDAERRVARGARALSS